MKRILTTGLALLFFASLSAQDLLIEQITVSPTNPLSKERTEDRARICEETKMLFEAPVKKVHAVPSAAIFPGAVAPDAEQITRTVTLSHQPIPEHLRHIVKNLYYSGKGNPTLYSTGLYAIPGEPITIRIPDELRDKVSIQIGIHSDRLNYWMAEKEDWRRLPILTISRPLTKRTTEIASPFGGLVYLSCPPMGEACSGEVTISGAVAAPYFKLGETTAEQWQEEVQKSGAPWGELECEGVILTLSTPTLRKIDDPEQKLRAWDLIIGACYDLAQIPTPFFRKQRIVTDAHISGGFMHSGYPIMVSHCPEIGWDNEAPISDPNMLVQGKGCWGFFHEIGHNMQNAADWVFNGTTEVSVNFFTLYIFDHILLGREGAHPSIGMAASLKMIQDHFKNGAPFEKWKNDPFLALCTFRLMQTDFGWEPFKAVFRRFLEDDKNPDNERRNDQWKIDHFVTYFSDAVQRNLAPYFGVWNIPVSEEVQKELQKYPEWMPYHMKSILK